jgi:PIN domain nuclease of toxin-antitoxin system
MRLLLDTHVFLWLTADDKRLADSARRMILDASSVYISSASIWEIAIKLRVGKLRVDPDDAIQEMEINGFKELAVKNVHAARVAKLPLLHNDPFDRLLVAQVVSEDMRLLTADERLKPYSELVILV